MRSKAVSNISQTAPSNACNNDRTQPRIFDICIYWTVKHVCVKNILERHQSLLVWMNKINWLEKSIQSVICYIKGSCFRSFNNRKTGREQCKHEEPSIPYITIRIQKSSKHTHHLSNEKYGKQKRSQGQLNGRASIAKVLLTTGGLQGVEGLIGKELYICCLVALLRGKTTHHLYIQDRSWKNKGERLPSNKGRRV